MSKLASIQTIKEIIPIDGADNIEAVTFNQTAWQCVAKKGEFKIEDKCVYIQIDSIVPDTPIFEFMRTRDFRVRTIKLKGTLSQGLALPLSYFPELVNPSIGSDVSEKIGVRKYEKPGEKVSDFVPKTRFQKYLHKYLFKWFPFLKSLLIKPDKIPFPTHLVSKTDEERIQNIPGLLSKYSNNRFFATYKLDGSSITIIRDKNWLGKPKYRICSRNWEMVKGGDDWTKVFKGLMFDKQIEKLVKYHNTNDIIVQGEMIGPKFNGNKHKLTFSQIRLFNIFVKGKRLRPNSFLDVTTTLSIPICPFHDLRSQGKTDYLPNTVEEVLKLAEVEDVLNPGSGLPAEGLVFRSEDGNVSFKVINNAYLLKHKE